MLAITAATKEIRRVGAGPKRAPGLDTKQNHSSTKTGEMGREVMSNFDSPLEI